MKLDRLFPRLLSLLLILALLPLTAVAEDAAAPRVLYILDAPSGADASLIALWEGEGCQVTVASLTKTSECLSGSYKPIAPDADAKAVARVWDDLSLTKTLAGFIRTVQPHMVVYGAPGAMGEKLDTAVLTAAEKAADPLYETKTGANTGVWMVGPVYRDTDEALKNGAMPAADDGTAALRAYCASLFADAQHGDTASIPYPEARDAEGFLPEGQEFVWEDAENGLWSYASSTLAVDIIRYEQPELARVWFVSDIRFDPAAESFHSQQYEFGSFAGQMIYPETLAQSSRMVFGMNGDYYIYREGKRNTGNIVRNYKVLYDHKNNMGFPNLDTAALYDDGSMRVYDAGSVTATQLTADGTVHDALSFGPWLVRDGQLRVYAGANFDATEPRSSLGMVAPGHYKVITVEGRFNKGVGPQGINLNTLAMLQYANGVNEAINLDGGNTAVLIFMGKKLNRTASKSGKGTTQPRNMSELFGIGRSEYVHTDMIDHK